MEKNFVIEIKRQRGERFSSDFTVIMRGEEEYIDFLAQQDPINNPYKEPDKLMHYLTDHQVQACAIIFADQTGPEEDPLVNVEIYGFNNHMDKAGLWLDFDELIAK